jgi:hypothetical protein
LTEPEEKCEIAVNLFVTFQLPSSLDTFPGGRDLDEDALLRNANRLIELNEMLCFGYHKSKLELAGSNNEKLTDGSSLVETQTCIYFCGDATWDDREDRLSKFDKKTVDSRARLGFDIATFGLSVLDGDIDEFLVCRLV